MPLDLSRPRPRRVALCLAMLLLTTLLTEMPAHAQSNDSGNLPARIVVESLGGLLAGSVSLLAVGGVTAATCDGDGFGCLAIGALAGGAAAIFGIPGGVTLAGDLMGGSGSFGWALVGTLGGIVGSGLVLTLANAADIDSPVLYVLAVATLVAGPVVGYELSHSANTSADATRTQPLIFGLALEF